MHGPAPIVHGVDIDAARPPESSRDPVLMQTG